MTTRGAWGVRRGEACLRDTRLYMDFGSTALCTILLSTVAKKSGCVVKILKQNTNISNWVQKGIFKQRAHHRWSVRACGCVSVRIYTSLDERYGSAMFLRVSHCAHHRVDLLPILRIETRLHVGQ